MSKVNVKQQKCTKNFTSSSIIKETFLNWKMLLSTGTTSLHFSAIYNVIVIDTKYFLVKFAS